MKLAFPFTCVPTRTTGIGMKKLVPIGCFSIAETPRTGCGMPGQKAINRYNTYYSAVRAI
jgi:hypothetical protein